MSFKKKLTLSTQGNKSVVEYLQSMKIITDELTLAQAPVTEDDLIIFILNGLGMEFREISTAIRVRETPISLEELHDKLVDFEAIIKQKELVTTPAMTANFIRKGKGYEYSYQRGTNSKNNTFNTFQSCPSYNYARRKSNQFNASSTNSRPTCQLCGKFGHSAKIYRQYKI